MKTTALILVTNCAGCPFYRWPTRLCTQQHGSRPVDGDPAAPPPDWCPLRAADQKVFLRLEDEG